MTWRPRGRSLGPTGSILGSILLACAEPAAAVPRPLERSGEVHEPKLSAPDVVVGSPDGAYVYVGTRLGDGINVFRRHAGTGVLRFVEIEPPPGNTVGLAVSPDGVHVYAASENDRLTAFARDPVTGALTLVDQEIDGVGGVDGLDFAYGVAVSPDGAHVYAVGLGDDAVSIFARDAGTGALTFVGLARDGIGGADGLDGPGEVTVSPDGAHVYVASAVEDALAVFERDAPSGTLTFVEALRDGVGGVDGLDGVDYVVVSGDGAHVYTASNPEDAVAVFARNAATGELGFVEVERNGVGGVTGLSNVNEVAVSPDGSHVYVNGSPMAIFARDGGTGQLTFVAAVAAPLTMTDPITLAVSADDAHVYAAGFSNALVGFSRDQVTGALALADVVTRGPFTVAIAFAPDGTTVYTAGVASVGVFDRDSVTGTLTHVQVKLDGLLGIDGLNGARGLASSQDGAHLYVASDVDDAVVVFAREPGTGELTLVEVERDGIGGVDGLDGASSVTSSLDDVFVYVAGADDDAVAVFARDAGTGALDFVELERDGVGGIDGLDGVRSVTVSPDDAHVYTAAAVDDAVVVFDRDGTTGTLTFVEAQRDGVAGVDGLDGASSVAVSPDGAHLYAAAEDDEALTVFTRNPVTGTLAAVEVERNDVDGVSGMRGARSVAVHPDGEHVYVASSSFLDDVAAFARDAASGEVRFVEEAEGNAPVAVSTDGAHVYAGPIYRLGFAGCDPAPLAGCHTTERTFIRMLASASLVDWRWNKGAADLADFGQPTLQGARTHYALCAYDESGPPELIFRALAPDGGWCKVPTKRTCWKAIGPYFDPEGWRYRDGFQTPEGLFGIKLRPGLPGKASISVKASRENVRLPAFPLALPLRVQLQASNGECWEATYGEAAFNNPGGFGAATD